jgi:hypothetical protein
MPEIASPNSNTTGDGTVSPADATQLLTLYGTLRRSPRSSPPLAAAARLRDSPVAAASPRDRSVGSLCDRCQSDQRRMPTGRKGSNARGAATRSDRPGGRRIYSCARRCGLWRCDRCRAQVRLAGRSGGAMDRCPRGQAFFAYSTTYQIDVDLLAAGPTAAILDGVASRSKPARAP